eukprot:1321328-Rhodomonas_salina.3
MASTDSAYLPMPALYHVRYCWPCIVLLDPARSAMSGPDTPTPCLVLRACIRLRPHYAMSGTERAYRATRAEGRGGRGPSSSTPGHAWSVNWLRNQMHETEGAIQFVPGMGRTECSEGGTDRGRCDCQCVRGSA